VKKGEDGTEELEELLEAFKTFPGGDAPNSAV